MMGPVHENETTTRVRAIKNMPTKLPVPALLSALLLQELGNSILKAPKKEIPKIKNTRKNTRLAIQFVARLFSAVGPKITVIKKPSKVKITMMDTEYETAFFIPSTLV